MSWDTYTHDNLINVEYVSISTNANVLAVYVNGNIIIYDCSEPSNLLLIDSIEPDAPDVFLPYCKLSSDGSILCLKTSTEVKLYYFYQGSFDTIHDIPIPSGQVDNVVFDLKSDINVVRVAIDDVIYIGQNANWTTSTVNGKVLSIDGLNYFYKSGDDVHLSLNGNDNTFPLIDNAIIFNDKFLLIDSSGIAQLRSINNLDVDILSTVTLSQIIILRNNALRLDNNAESIYLHHIPDINISNTLCADANNNFTRYVTANGSSFTINTLRRYIFNTTESFTMTVSMDDVLTTQLSVFSPYYERNYVEFNPISTDGDIFILSNVANDANVSYATISNPFINNYNLITFVGVEDRDIIFTLTTIPEVIIPISFDSQYAPIQFEPGEPQTVLYNYKVYTPIGAENLIQWSTNLFPNTGDINASTITPIQMTQPTISWSVEGVSGNILTINASEEYHPVFFIDNNDSAPGLVDNTFIIDISQLVGQHIIALRPNIAIAVPASVGINFINWGTVVQEPNFIFNVQGASNVSFQLSLNGNLSTNVNPLDNSVQQLPLIDGYNVIQTTAENPVFTTKTETPVFINPTFSYDSDIGVIVTYASAVTGNFDKVSYFIDGTRFVDATIDSKAYLPLHIPGTYDIEIVADGNVVAFPLIGEVTILDKVIVYYHNYNPLTRTVTVAVEDYGLIFTINGQPLIWNTELTIATLSDFTVPGVHRIEHTGDVDVVPVLLEITVPPPVTLHPIVEYDEELHRVIVSVPNYHEEYGVTFKIGLQELEWNETFTEATLQYNIPGTHEIIGEAPFYVTLDPENLEFTVPDSTLTITVSNVDTKPGTINTLHVVMSSNDATYEIILPPSFSQFMRMENGKLIVSPSTPTGNYTLRAVARLNLMEAQTLFTVKVTRSVAGTFTIFYLIFLAFGALY